MQISHLFGKVFSVIMKLVQTCSCFRQGCLQFDLALRDPVDNELAESLRMAILF